MADKKQRILWVDILNISACAGVLLLHCLRGVEGTVLDGVTFNRVVSLAVLSCVLWPVNVFFMLSGFTLIRDNTLTTKDGKGLLNFYNKRLKRILVPVLFWNTVYAIVYITPFIKEGVPIDIKHFVGMYSQLEFNPYMWFFIPLIVIYIAMPFFSIMMSGLGRQLQKWFVGIAFFFVCVVPFLLPEENVLFKELFPLGKDYLVLAALGFYFGNHNLSKRGRSFLYLLGVIAAFVTGVCYLSKGWAHILFAYKAFPCVIMSVAVFVFFKNVDWQRLIEKCPRVSSKTVARISSYSLGVYLVQAAFFSIYSSILPADMNILLRFIVMYVSCVLAVMIIKKTPILCRTV